MAQLTQGLTPHKIALTIAIGSAIAMFPIPFTSTLICLIVGVFMRLNQPIIQAVNYGWTPVHLLFIRYSFIWGERLFDAAHTRLEFRQMMKLLREDPFKFLRDYDQTALHAIFVWAILVPFWSVAVYYVALPILIGINKVRIETAAKAAAEKARDHPVP